MDVFSQLKFCAGKFVSDRTDDVSSLTPEQLTSLFEWQDFYNKVCNWSHANVCCDSSLTQNQPPPIHSQALQQQRVSSYRNMVQES